jgi:hypothetical protein
MEGEREEVPKTASLAKERTMMTKIPRVLDPREIH